MCAHMNRVTGKTFNASNLSSTTSDPYYQLLYSSSMNDKNDRHKEMTGDNSLKITPSLEPDRNTINCLIFVKEKDFDVSNLSTNTKIKIFERADDNAEITINTRDNSFEIKGFYYYKIVHLANIPSLMEKLPVHFANDEIKFKIIENPANLKYISEDLQKDVVEMAIEKDGMVLEFVFPSLQNINLCKKAVSQNTKAFQFVNRQFQTEEICELVKMNGLSEWNSFDAFTYLGGNIRKEVFEYHSQYARKAYSISTIKRHMNKEKDKMIIHIFSKNVLTATLSRKDFKSDILTFDMLYDLLEYANTGSSCEYKVFYKYFFFKKAEIDYLKIFNESEKTCIMQFEWNTHVSEHITVSGNTYWRYSLQPKKETLELHFF